MSCNELLKALPAALYVQCFQTVGHSLGPFLATVETSLLSSFPVLTCHMVVLVVAVALTME